MPVTFGNATAAQFYEPQIGPRGARLDPRMPFTLDGELVVSGGRGGRDIIVRLHLAGKTRDAVAGAVGQWVDQEGRRRTLVLEYPAGAAAKNASFSDCVLARVVPGEIAPTVFDTDVGAGGYRADPVLIFRQLVVAPSPRIAAGGFGA